MKMLIKIEKIVTILVALIILVISILVILQIFHPDTLNLGDPYYKSLLANERMPIALYLTWTIVVLAIIELVILIIKKINEKK